MSNLLFGAGGRPACPPPAPVDELILLELTRAQGEEWLDALPEGELRHQLRARLSGAGAGGLRGAFNEGFEHGYERGRSDAQQEAEEARYAA